MSASTGGEIRRRRKALGISQGQLAELIRTNYITIQRYEHEEYPIPERRAKQIDAALTTLKAGFEIARQAASQAGQP